MTIYRYGDIIIRAINYTEVKRIIESRIERPLNPFKLEILMPSGNFKLAAV